MKKQRLSLLFILGFLYLILFNFGRPPVHAADEKQIFLNETAVDCPYKLIHHKQELLVPFEWFIKNMGGTNYSYHPETKTISVTVDNYLKQQEYLSYLNGLANASLDYPLASRLQGFTLSPYPISNDSPAILNQTPLYLEIHSGSFAITFTLYDYQLGTEQLYVGANWLNTLFLATIDETKSEVHITYPTRDMLDEKITHFQRVLSPLTKEEALALWIHGLQYRNGGLQYVALSKPLRSKALSYIQTNGFVTGGSSPSLETAHVVSATMPSDDEVIYTVEFQERLVSNEYAPHPLTQIITIKKEIVDSKEFWFIQKVEGRLDYYTILN